MIILDLEGFTNKEIAKIINKEPEWVTKEKSRAKSLFRELLVKQGYVEVLK